MSDQAANTRKNTSDLQELLRAARSELNDPARNKFFHCDKPEDARFELFHAGLSICSQKIRVVLAEKAAPYWSHEMVILSGKGIYAEQYTPAENYRPGYVRLRMHAGGAQLLQRLAERHTMSTSVRTEGFDACVVPTLVDLAGPTGIVDSFAICTHIDDSFDGAIRLIPAQAAARDEVMRQVEIVDSIPHPGQLYGVYPDDPRPFFVKEAMRDVYEIKCQVLADLIKQNSDDQALVRVYQAKIAKERAGEAIYNDPDFIANVHSRFVKCVDDLEAQLARQSGPWVCGEHFSLADVVWGISLYRIHWLGHAYLWNERPHIKRYLPRIYARPSLKNAVIAWPSPMPASPHTADVAA